MYDKKQIPLKEFKKGKRKVFVDFINGIVIWKKNHYKLTLVNVGGTNYPYVILKDIKPIKLLNQQINSINEHKKDLKFCEYTCNGHEYFVTGIGPEAIRAYKDESLREDWFRYNEDEGQKLLQTIMNHLKQSVLQTEEQTN